MYNPVAINVAADDLFQNWWSLSAEYVQGRCP